LIGDAACPFIPVGQGKSRWLLVVCFCLKYETKGLNAALLSAVYLDRALQGNAENLKQALIS
jgi:hypothetical protein